MTLYKRGRVYYYDFWFEGERFGPKTTGCTNRREAQAYEDDLKAQARNQRLSSRSVKWTVAQALDAWWEAAAPTLRRQSTYLSRLKALKDLLGTSTLDRLSSGDVQRYVSKRLALGRKASTVRDELTKLKTALRWVRRNNPEVRQGAEIEWPRLKVASKVRFLMDGEEEALLAALDPDAVRQRRPGVQERAQRAEAFDLCEFLIDTGARIGEAAGATWDMVRWNARTLALTRWKTDSQSVIPLSERALLMLRRRFTERDRSSPYIFVTSRVGEDGDREIKDTLIREAMDRAGLNAPHLVRQWGTCTVHSLRHTYGTRLAQAGVSPQVVMKMMGHSDIATTMIYVNLVEGDGVDEVRAVLDRAAHKSPNIVQLYDRQAIEDADVLAS